MLITAFSDIAKHLSSSTLLAVDSYDLNIYIVSLHNYITLLPI